MAYNPLQAMLSGAFNPEAGPLPQEAAPGLSPMVPAMLGRDDVFGVSAAQPDPSSYLGDEPSDDPYAALYQRHADLEPIRNDPDVKHRLLQVALPLIAAAIAGKSGGYGAAAGALAGWNKATTDNQALDLERSKLDSLKRDRALQRDLKLMDSRREHLKDKTAAVEKLLDTAMKMKTPAVARAYLDSVAPEYAHLGLDTRKLWTTVEPQLVRQAQEDAAEAFRKGITSQAEFARAAGREVEPEELLSSTVDYDGKKMTLRELGRMGAQPVTDSSVFTKSAKDEFSIEEEIRTAIEDREKVTGEPLTGEDRREIALQVRSERADAVRDPVLHELNLERLKALRRKRLDAESGGDAGPGVKKTVYSTLQERQRVQLYRAYADQSKDFAGRARAWETIRNVATRAKAGNKQSQRALVYNMYKMWDPNSAVLPGEYASLQQSMDVPDRFKNWIPVMLGEITLSQKQVDEMLAEAKGAYGNYRDMHDSVAMDYAQNAKRFGLEPWDVVKDYNAADQPMNLKGFPRPRALMTTEDGGTGYADEAEPEAPPPPPPGRATPTFTMPGTGFQMPGSAAAVPGAAPAGVRPTGRAARVQASAPPSSGGRPPAKDIRVGAPKGGVSVGDRVYVGDPPSWKTVTAVRGPDDFDAK